MASGSVSPRRSDAASHSVAVWTGALWSPRELLRRFLVSKLVMVLLLPHDARLPLLVGCVFSLRALSLLRSPKSSSKPSAVLLHQLALADLLPLFHLTLQLGASLSLGMEVGLWRWLLDAHHLASLLLLGLLGLEAVLVSQWPLQTRLLRTSHWARLGCSLVWGVVLLELLVSLAFRLQLNSDPKIGTVALPEYLKLTCPLALLTISIYLRKALWLANLWLHYHVFYSQQHKRHSCFH